jgi:glycosyltransferase involved in cell wall biosynthesis
MNGGANARPMQPKLSLVVAVYNAVRPLQLIFAALRRQSYREFEVIVADDGSGDDIRSLVDRERRKSPFPVQHLWQEDRGFRKNAMLNKAIAASLTDYLVFIDGDCLPHREFLQDHALNRKPGALLSGRRVNWSREISDAVSVADVDSGAYERFTLKLIADGFLARSANLEDGIRIPNRLVRKVLYRNRPRILGCNFSVPKELLEKVNGFNEEYQAPGLGEDSDVAFRLQLIGVKLVTLRYLAVLYHLFHSRTIVPEANQRLYDAVVRGGDPLCMNGLRKLGALTAAENTPLRESHEQ